MKNKDGVQVSSDGVVYESDLTNQTPDEIKEILLDYSRQIFEEEYDKERFEKPREEQAHEL